MLCFVGQVGRLLVERIGRLPLIVVDEVGYIPFDPEAASLFFALVANRYERSSIIVSSNKTFSAWLEIFGDPIAVAAWSTASCITARCSCCAAKATGSRARAKRCSATGMTVESVQF